MRVAAFLDRDGTLNREKGYIRNVDDLELIPGAAEAVRRLNDAGILAILTTNQTGAARGFYGEEHILALNNRLAKLLKEEANARLDAVFYCPHLYKNPEENRRLVAEFVADCDCRKPRTGMIDQAQKQFPDIDLANSYVFGDKATDVDLAVNAGCKSALLKTGYGERVLAGKYQELKHTPDIIADNILSAVKQITAPG